MITVNIGRTFLEAFNNKYGRGYSAKEFFEKEYFELFFNHEKYLQWAQNSPFVQGVSSSRQGRYGITETLKDEEDKTLQFENNENLEDYITNEIHPRNDVIEIKSKSKKGIKILKKLNDVERRKKLIEFQAKVHEAVKENNIDASIAIGYPASTLKEFATTSGLVTTSNIKISEEDIYLSWIGAGLSLGVAGGYSILFNNSKILLKTYEGWKIYRKFLNDPTLDHLAPNKFTSWNGQWVNFAFGKRFRPNFDYNTLNNKGFFKVTNQGTVINTVKWSQLFFSLSSNFPNDSSTAYIFSLGQMNKTLGFYPFYFQQATTLIKFYKLLFGKNEALKDSVSFEQLYGLHIKRACELGVLGLKALEPEGLRKYFDKDKMPSFKKVKAKTNKKYTDEENKNEIEIAKHKDYEKNVIPFRTYKTWLIAMISKNKEEMIDYTSEIARVLHQSRDNSKKEGSTKISNQINDILTSSSKMNFISALTELISNKDIPSDNLSVFKELKNRVHLMTAEDFKYLITLIKFDYTYQTRTS